MPAEHPLDLESRLATTESQIERITKDIASLSESVSGLRDTISRSISLLSDKIGAAAVPNFSTMAAWAGVILTTIAIFGGLVGYFWMREFDRQARDVDRVQSKQDYGITQDLEELRQRRLWGPLKIPEAAK
jgi:uncharacterized protein YbjT (DUF2867 family)